MYALLKPILFLLDAEKAHYFTLKLLRFGLKLPLISTLVKKEIGIKSAQNSVNVCGITFPNAIGLAAGFDKNAEHIDLMAQLGFGFIEIGTVTPLAQDGNPKPRLFRLKADECLINRMGFNNKGVNFAVENLKKIETEVVIGGNIGKNKVTPNEQAVSDYEKCFEALYPYVDYFVINVSSPNTPGLRELQDKGPLTKIIKAVQVLNESKTYQKPIFLKIAPDLNEAQLLDIVEVATSTEIDGLIATNTTISRENLKTPASQIDKIGNGGLSGKVIFENSTSVLKFLKGKLPEDFPIIGVGGIDSGKAAKAKIEAGASLIQIYSGLVFKGPNLLEEVNREIG